MILQQKPQFIAHVTQHNLFWSEEIHLRKKMKVKKEQEESLSEKYLAFLITHLLQCMHTLTH